MKSRVVLLFIFVVSLFGLGLVRVFYLQTIPNANLSRLQKNQFTSRISLLPRRGKILDRFGEELASSVTAYSLYADPLIIEHPRKLAKKLATLLGASNSELFEKITQEGRRFVWLKRQMEPEQMQKIKALGVPGLIFVEEGKRSYPNLGVASQVLGFVGLDGNGLEGLEKKYDEELRGEKISIMSRRDAHGRPLVVSGQIFETTNDGGTIESTLDKDIQYELEHQLMQVLEKQNAKRAMGIVMDPNTGEILAMGSVPSFNPAQPNKSLVDDRRNNLITDIFEPGSTFKIITAAAALRTGRIHPNTKYFCENGKMKIGNRWIHEAESAHKFQYLSLAEIIEVSSNIGSTKVAFDVGEKAFREMIDEFGFGKQSGIDFQGEGSGIINKSSWNEHLLSNVSFGHGIGVTALQIANAYSAIANGGKLMKPYLVRRVVDHQGNLITETTPKVIKNILTPKEASTLTLLLSGVTQEGGTGMLARVDGYPVAGKTGTAQKVNPTGRGYVPGKYISSFAGFVPASQPQFAIYIVVDSPQKDFYGAQVAAPVFNKIASFALRKKGFLPIILSEKSLSPLKGNLKKKSALVQSIKIDKSQNPDELFIPDFKGLTLKEVARTIEQSPGLKSRDIQYIGQGVAYHQTPLPGLISSANLNQLGLKENQKIKIYLQPAR